MTANFWRPLRKLTFADVETLKDTGDREKSILDYKRFSNPNQFVLKDVAEDFAAFANGAGGRLIYGAIERDERLVGFDGIDQKNLRGWTSRFRNAAHTVQPPVDVDVCDIEMPNGKFIVVIEVRSGQIGPFQYLGKYLQRAGNGNVPMPHSSVVQAVVTATSRGIAPQPVNGPGRLDGNPFHFGAEGWCFGVEISPAYYSRRPIYDALTPEADRMKDWLSEHGYDSITKVPGALIARHNTGWHLNLLGSGSVTMIAGSSAETSTSIHQLRHWTKRFVRDSATCLFFAEPLFTVNLVARLWVHGKAARVMVRGKDEEEKDTVHWIGNCAPIVADHEHQVHDLRDDGTGHYTADTVAFADRVRAHVTLVTEASRATAKRTAAAPPPDDR